MCISLASGCCLEGTLDHWAHALARRWGCRRAKVAFSGSFGPLQRFAVILDRSALWSIDAYLEELRGKIGEAVKRAIPKSKGVWLNLTATRYRPRLFSCLSVSIKRSPRIARASMEQQGSTTVEPKIDDGPQMLRVEINRLTFYSPIAIPDYHITNEVGYF